MSTREGEGARARPVPASHRALVDKIDAFGRGVASRRGADLTCRAGCTACCRASLTVSDVEAALVWEGLASLDGDARGRLARRLAAAPGEACVLLDDDGRCSIYAARPLVCRTQGLPLRYPDGTIPAAAILARGRAEGGEITWCPLNFTERSPGAADVLDAGRVDMMLALSNRGAGGDPTRRTSLEALAREALGEGL